MKSFYHYYDILFAKDKTVFEGPFTPEQYESIDWIEDASISDLKLMVKTIQGVRPDLEIIDVIYNLYSFDDKTQKEHCEECRSILSYVKEYGKWIDLSSLKD